MCNCDCELTKEQKWQQIREDYALQMGRDVMKMGLVPYLDRLVGEANTGRLLAQYITGASPPKPGNPLRGAITP